MATQAAMSKLTSSSNSFLIYPWVSFRRTALGYRGRFGSWPSECATSSPPTELNEDEISTSNDRTIAPAGIAFPDHIDSSVPLPARMWVARGRDSRKGLSRCEGSEASL